MRLEDHIAAVDDALDALAEDSTVALADYAIAMDEIAYRVKAASFAAQNDLVKP